MLFLLCGFFLLGGRCFCAVFFCWVVVAVLRLLPPFFLFIMFVVVGACSEREGELLTYYFVRFCT